MKAMRLLIKTFVLIIIIVTVIYLAVTSSFFIKKIILPIVSKKVSGNVTVESVKFAPLRGEVALNQLNYDTQTCKAAIKRFECKFNLFDYFSKKISVKKFVLEDSNIEIISKGASQEKVESEPQGPIKLYRFDVKNVSIINFNLKYSMLRDNASANTITELKNFNLAVPYFETSSKAKVEFTSTILTTAASETLKGFIQGKLNAVLNDNSFPKELTFDSSLKMGEKISPFYLKFNSDQKEEKTPFQMSAKLISLPLQPFFQTFLTGNYQKTNGFINSFNVSAKGPDFANIISLDGVDGNLNMNLSDIYIPVEMENNPIVRIILLPFDVISKLDQSVLDRAFQKNSARLFNSSSSILKGKNIIDFQNGIIEAVMTNGNTRINKFSFTGTPKSEIEMMDVSGVINRDQAIDLYTKTNIAGVQVPMHIKGTIKNPKPDTVNLIDSMLKNTAEKVGNIIDGASGNSEAGNAASAIINTVDSLSNQSSTPSDKLGNLFNTIKSLSK